MLFSCRKYFILDRPSRKLPSALFKYCVSIVITGLPNSVGISVSFRGFFTGLPMSKPSRGLRLVCLFSFFFFFFFFFFFSVSVKVLPVTPPVSGVFVYRAFCAYFLRIERVVELRRFLWWTQ